MSSLKRCRKVGQGQFQKWEMPGQEFEGTWHGMHEGRFGGLGTLETVDGRLTFPLLVALRDRLAQVKVGTPGTRSLYGPPDLQRGPDLGAAR